MNCLECGGTTRAINSTYWQVAPVKAERRECVECGARATWYTPLDKVHGEPNGQPLPRERFIEQQKGAR